MSFLFFIILLLIFMLVWPLVKTGFKVWSQVRQMKQQFHNAQQRQYGTPPPRPGRQRRRDGKIFGPTDGEYVQFEEFTEQRAAVQYVEVRDSEPRITDAQFEEL